MYSLSPVALYQILTSPPTTLMVVTCCTVIICSPSIMYSDTVLLLVRYALTEGTVRGYDHVHHGGAGFSPGCRAAK